MLGPSLGPILGGVLAQGFNWRAIFWFLAVFAGMCAFSFIFFRETFRRERSLTYQTVLRRVLEQEAQKVIQKQSASGKVLNQNVGQHMPTAEESRHGSAPGKNKANRDMGASIAMPTTEAPIATKEIRLTLKDINPFRPMFQVLRRVNNVLILSASGEFILATVW